MRPDGRCTLVVFGIFTVAAAIFFSLAFNIWGFVGPSLTPLTAMQEGHTIVMAGMNFSDSNPPSGISEKGEDSSRPGARGPGGWITSGVYTSPGMWHFTNVCRRLNTYGQNHPNAPADIQTHRIILEVFGAMGFEEDPWRFLDKMSSVWVIFKAKPIVQRLPSPPRNGTTLAYLCHKNPNHFLHDELLSIAQAAYYHSFNISHAVTIPNCSSKWILELLKFSGFLKATQIEESVRPFGEVECFHHLLLPKAMHARFTHKLPRPWKGVVNDYRYPIPRIRGYSGVFGFPSSYIPGYVRKRVHSSIGLPLPSKRSFDSYFTAERVRVLVYDRKGEQRRTWSNSQPTIDWLKEPQPNPTSTLLLTPFLLIIQSYGDRVLIKKMGLLGDMSVKDQIKAHAETDILLTVHGGSTANSFFLRPGAHLIEFACQFNSWIASYSSLLNLKHHFLIVPTCDGHFEKNFSTPEAFFVPVFREILGDPNHGNKSLLPTPREQVMGNISVVITTTTTRPGLWRGFFTLFERYFLVEAEKYNIQVVCYVCVKNFEPSIYGYFPVWAIVIHTKGCKIPQNLASPLSPLKTPPFPPFPPPLTLTFKDEMFFIKPFNFTQLFKNNTREERSIYMRQSVDEDGFLDKSSLSIICCLALAFDLTTTSDRPQCPEVESARAARQMGKWEDAAFPILRFEPELSCMMSKRSGNSRGT
ncbi:hypothetical protein AAMO2058_001068100 [Amorphochlora amoebiformis]